MNMGKLSYAIEEAFNNGAEVVWVDPHQKMLKLFPYTRDLVL